MSDNNSINLSALVLNIEEQRNNYKRKSLELENQVQIKNNKIASLKSTVHCLQIQIRVLKELLKRETNLNVDEMFPPAGEDGIHIYNYPNGNIPIIVHDILETKHYTIAPKKPSSVQHGKNFRTVKNQVELVEEKPEILEQKVNEVDEKLEEIVQENKLDVSYKETVDYIETLFSEIDSSRMYKKPLQNLKEARSKLLGKLNLDDYIKLTKTHILRLEKAFVKKKFDSKKMLSTISLSLSSLDQRILYYGQYYNSELEADDIQKLNLCLKVNMNYPKRYVPFILSEFSSKICNYNLCLSSIKETIKTIIVNPYGFSNLVYLELEKSSPDDPYSFYSLEKIDDNGQRCWKMECRLDEFSKIISEQIKTYCVHLFRKIYFDIFNDNTYRDDYQDRAPAAQHDCEQLIVTMISLVKTKSFTNMIRKLVVKYCVLKPSKLDKFNFTRDDPIVKKHFSQDDDYSKDLTSTIQRLFDNLSSEEAEKIWQNKSY